MFEAKNLSKVYKTKKGISVKAIDNISLKLPDTGMVFLLGKSGSGKSTLLNLLGGLDSYDSGEIIIKGVSTKDFTQQHFDSYRNTYVGFIFQEYNVLEDFTVGANIALALELQGIKAEDAEINRILESVDLTEYANRKPNELSGGQKQRVAIARALVKNPEIIMADEPTGALDSATGKQIFDTLKKLSSSKLIIVVSHDRDFAARYADRIIELADGRIINDSTLCKDVEDSIQQNVIFSGNTATIPEGYHLTEADREAINDYIDRLNSGMIIDLKGSSTESSRFVPTIEENIETSGSEEFKLIKSKLSLKNAFKIGGSNLKYKKFRLAMTILLSCISFILFGLADTLGSYDHVKTCTSSIKDSGITYASVSKAYRVGKDRKSYWNDPRQRFTKDELKTVSEESGIDFNGVWKPDRTLYFNSQIDNSVKLTASEFNLYATAFSGFVEITDDTLKKLDYKLLAGSLPDGGKNEIAISDYILRTFTRAGYCAAQGTDQSGDEEETFEKIDGPADMIGKTIRLLDADYTVTGVVDTNFDFSRYLDLIRPNEEGDTSDTLSDLMLNNELQYATSYNYSGMVMVGEGFIDIQLDNKPKTAETSKCYINFDSEYDKIFPNFVMKLSGVEKDSVIWLGEKADTLGENEFIITADLLSKFAGNESTDAIAALNNLPFIINIESKIAGEQSYHSDEFKIAGIIKNSSGSGVPSGTVVLNDTLFSDFYSSSQGDYSNLLGVMPESKEGITKLLSYCYDRNDPIVYQLNNPVNFELDTITGLLLTLAEIFLFIGLFFAVFAIIMLSNFIATSISHKKQEIGILRAIGSRSKDVFLIFFAESFLIALINFVVSSIGAFGATMAINTALRVYAGMLLTVLGFGLRQIALLLLISIAVAALSSFFPVRSIASKKPIDAIRNK